MLIMGRKGGEVFSGREEEEEKEEEEEERVERGRLLMEGARQRLGTIWLGRLVVR